MSKSLDNAISFNEEPKKMYRKVMSISDEKLADWWSLFTEGEEDLTDLFKDKKINPKVKKEELAWLLVCSFYGEETANQEQSNWTKQFSKKEIPDDISEYQDFFNPEQDIESSSNESRTKATLLKKEIDLLQKEKTLLEREIGLAQLLKEIGLTSSTSEARRKILEGAVKKQGEKITDPNKKISLVEGDDILFSLGKRKYKRVNTKWDLIHDLKAYLSYRKIEERKTARDEEMTQLSKGPFL